MFPRSYFRSILSHANHEDAIKILTVKTLNSLMDAKDADVQTAPHIMLASKDEPTDIVAAYKTAMGDQAEVTTYDTMHHGWMGARAKLEDAANVQEYERGYEQVGVFFSKHL